MGAKALFQRLNAPGDRCVVDVQHGRGAGQFAAAHNFEKKAKVVPIVHWGTLAVTQAADGGLCIFAH